MKKKLLPFILGCAMVATMPFVGHAETTEEYANEIPTGQTSPTDGDDSQNGFTEYNDVTTTENTVAKVFGSGADSIGNTRNTASTMQADGTGYPVTLQNEKQNYRDGTQIRSLVGDIDDTNTDFADQTNDAAGTTDLETSVPEFDMIIPASTVLPLGATRWRIGNVEINGRYFVRPDKVDVTTTHADFKHPSYNPSESDAHKLAHSIAFTVADKRYDNTSIEGLDRYYFQDGTTTKQANFPYAYTTYTSTDYQNGLVSEINETHQVWAISNDWTGKTAGKYTGSITFNAAVVTTDTDSMYTAANLYPGEGSEVQP